MTAAIFNPLVFTGVNHTFPTLFPEIFSAQSQQQTTDKLWITDLPIEQAENGLTLNQPDSYSSLKLQDSTINQNLSLSTMYDNIHRPLDQMKDVIDQGPSSFKQFLTKGAYWMIMGSALTGATIGVQQGYSEAAVVTAVTSAVFLTTWVLENINPARPDWRLNSKEAGVAGLHNIFSTGVMPWAIKQGLTVGAAYLLGSKGAETLMDAGALNSVGFDALPYAVQILAGFVVADFGFYWLHRFLHQNENLWEIHEIHHLTEKMTTFGAGQNHVINVLLSYGILTGSLYALGLDPGAATIVTAGIVAPNGFLQHSNAKIDIGKAEKLISGPINHRFHHSTDLNEGNSNFGNTLIIWDHIFGTYTNPQDQDSPKEVGVTHRRYIDESKNVWDNFSDHFVYPIKNIFNRFTKGANE